MSKYTAEDFAQANLATRGDYGVARKTDPTETDSWHIYGDGQGWFSDEEMAAGGWTPVVESRVTLDGLAGAWEAAEEADECRKGDVLIVPGSWGGYTIWAAARGTKLRAARVLSRAPREPWQDLADVLGTDNGELIGEHRTITEVAKALHERGVRVVGGDDDE